MRYFVLFLFLVVAALCGFYVQTANPELSTVDLLVRYGWLLVLLAIGNALALRWFERRARLKRYEKSREQQRQRWFEDFDE